MTKENVQTALAWLLENGHSNSVYEFYDILNGINEWALNIRFSTNPDYWTGFLRKSVKKLMKIDKVYYLNTGKHFLRMVNTNNKAEMLNFISELNSISRI